MHCMVLFCNMLWGECSESTQYLNSGAAGNRSWSIRYYLASPCTGAVSWDTWPVCWDGEESRPCGHKRGERTHHCPPTKESWGLGSKFRVQDGISWSSSRWNDCCCAWWSTIPRLHEQAGPGARDMGSLSSGFVKARIGRLGSVQSFQEGHFSVDGCLSVLCCEEAPHICTCKALREFKCCRNAVANEYSLSSGVILNFQLGIFL